MSTTKEKSPSPFVKVFDPDEFYSPEEVAAKLKVRPRQVRRWMDEQGLRFTRLPRGRRVLGRWILDFLAEDR